jgi:enoyl-CoA hydratase
MFTLTQTRRVAVLTMQHGKANALDTEFCNTLAAKFDELSEAESRAVVITGQGRIFSAGVDLLRATTSGPDYFRGFLPALARLYMSVFFFPKPVVAAVNGHAVAGGCILAACADRRLIARGEARIGVTELLVGVPFPPLAFEIMRYVTTHKFFPEVIFSAATYPPEEAVKRGLADEIVPPEQLLDLAVENAERLAALCPAAFALTKWQMRQPVADALERHGKRLDAATAEVWLAPETAAGMRDYVSRTFKKS